MRSGISTTIIAVIVVAIVVVGGAGAYFLFLGGGGGNTTPTTNTTSSQTPPAGSLDASVNSFISTFGNRDVTNLVKYFTDSSVAVWGGSAGGLGGTYTGVDQIKILYSTSIGHTSSLNVNKSNVQESSTGVTTATVTYHLAIAGVSNVVGAFNSTVDVSQNWVYQGGVWTVQNDNWNYLTFESNNPSEATVFPQWGLTMNGKSPSLAGEHVLEWNLAPFLALGVYITIAALGVALIWVRVRKQRQ